MRRAHDKNEERLNAVASRIRDEAGRQITVLPADVNDKACRTKVEAALRNNPDITALVGNAGVGSVASILQADVDKMTAMIDLNITALTRQSYAAAPAFLARGVGIIINIASGVGIAVKALNGVYSASKSYALGFGHSLQKDLAEKGVRVETVLPARPPSDLPEVRQCEARTSLRDRLTPPAPAEHPGALNKAPRAGASLGQSRHGRNTYIENAIHHVAGCVMLRHRR